MYLQLRADLGPRSLRAPLPRHTGALHEIMRPSLHAGRRLAHTEARVVERLHGES